VYVFVERCGSVCGPERSRDSSARPNTSPVTSRRVVRSRLRRQQPSAAHLPRDRRHTDLDARSLTSLEELASVLTNPTLQIDRLVARLRDFAGVKAPSKRTSAEVREIAVDRVPEPASAPPATDAARAASVPTPSPAPAPIPSETPTPASLLSSAASLLDSGLAALESLATEPWVPPVDVPEEAVVPIETLLYRGRAALDRAAELRDQLRRAGPTIDKADLEELFDLLELARAE